METLEKVRELCKQRGTSITRMERDLGFGNGSLAKAKSIKTDRLQKIADYFGVSIEYLMDSHEISYDKDNHVWEYDQNGAIYDALKDEELAARLRTYAEKLIEIKKLEDI
jgi:transcriptional regulator with XRE-family HTH domain